jgi:hypothetical protein
MFWTEWFRHLVSVEMEWDPAPGCLRVTVTNTAPTVIVLCAENDGSAGVEQLLPQRQLCRPDDGTGAVGGAGLDHHDDAVGILEQGCGHGNRRGT